MVVGEFSTRADLVVVGAGPAGIAAAARGRELGLDVTIVDHPRAVPDVDPDETALALGRLEAAGATLLPGTARFDGGRQLTVAGDEQVSRVRFRRAILAIGAGPALPPPLEALRAAGDRRLVPGVRTLDPDGADEDGTSNPFEDLGPVLAWRPTPEVLITVVGRALLGSGGICGLDGAVPITSAIALAGDRLLADAASGLEDDVEAWTRDALAGIGLGIVEHATDEAVLDDGARFSLDPGACGGGLDRLPAGATFGHVVAAPGGPPRLDDLGLDATGIELDEHGFVRADDAGRTGDPRILAAGAVRGPMTAAGLARTRAIRAAEGVVAAEVAAGRDAAGIEAVVVRRTANADQPIAWCRRIDAADVPEAERTSIALDANDPALAADVELRHARITWETATGVLLAAAIDAPGAPGAVAAAAAVIEMGGVLDDLAALLPTDDEQDSPALALLARRALDHAAGGGGA